MTPPQEPCGNRLLSALPATERQRLQSHLKCVDLVPGQVLCEPGVLQHHVYFPTDAIVSLDYLTHSGATAEVAIVGSEGVVGVSLFLGGGFMTSYGIVHGAGQALRGAAHAVESLFEQSAPVRQLLLRYIQALMTQMAQVAACNRHHGLEQRLCRLLLQRLDRTHGIDIATTQEQIAHALGVRREGVTEAALKLQAAGILRNARGHIAVLDRRQLMHRSCECYAALRQEYDRLLPDIRSPQHSPTGSWADWAAPAGRNAGPLGFDGLSLGGAT
jgi:CRP-like cAMP-binding protein